MVEGSNPSGGILKTDAEKNYLELTFYKTIIASKKSGTEESYKIFKSLKPDTKIQLVLRLEEKRAEIEGRKCTGLSIDELEKALRKFKSGLSSKQIYNAIKSCDEFCVIIPRMREVKEGRYETVYKTAPHEYQLLDALLKTIGWVEERIKI